MVRIANLGLLTFLRERADLSLLLFTAMFFVVGCSTSSNTVSLKASISSHVAALERDPLIVELGTARIVETKNTDFIIESGNIAIPILVQALQKAENRPRHAAYIIYCLRMLKARAEAGRQEATRLYSRWMAKGSRITVEEQVAVNEILLYLRDINTPTSGTNGP